MDIGIGLPNTLAAPGGLIAQWARRAEERGFSTLATLDRIVYPSYDSLTTLAVAAGATARIGLLTDILIAPLYQPVWLAKAAAGLDAMSGGRLTLGLGVGGRPDDFAAMERLFERRGRLMDETLFTLHRAWAGEHVTGEPRPVVPAAAVGKRVQVLIGGTSDAAVRRTVRYADGWTAGGGGPDAAAPMIGRVRQAWRDAERPGEPRIAALAYYGLGDPESSRAALRAYYAFIGDRVDGIAKGLLDSPAAIAEAVRAYAEIGVTELVLAPTVGDLAEIDRLADAVP